MKRYIIATGTVTYAIKGKDLLRKKGFNIREDILTIEEIKEEILKAVKGGKEC